MWNANTESSLAGYIVQYGTQAGNPSTSIDVGNVTSRTLTGLTAGSTYYFRVVAYNSTGQQSTPSSEVSYAVPSVPGNPTITSVTPASGPATGGTQITITGASFAAGATVRVGGALASSVTLVSATQLRATTPAGTVGAQAVQVTNTSGASATRAAAFTYTAVAPTLTSVSPTSGPTAGGTTITLTGTGFVSGATVRVGGTSATSVTVVSGTQITARTPAGTAGARDVQVTNPSGQSATRTGAFTYTTSTGGFVITSVSPASGPMGGGTIITVNGSGFVRGESLKVKVDDTLCMDLVYVSSTQLRATTQGGPLGARAIKVRNPDGQYAVLPGAFTYTSSSTSQSTATFTRYLAEGVQTEQMNTQLAIANPQDTDAQATLTFETAAGEQTQLAVDVPARSRRTVDAASVPELAGTSFSTKLESNQELALDRLISLNADGAAASLESAVDQPATSWYFAEGSTVDPQELFYLVQNPGSTPASVRVRYLLPDGQAPVERTYSVAAGSRATIWVDREDPSLATTDVAAEITSVDGTPIVVERSLYLREAGSTSPRGGDTSTGATAPATRWFVEGATGAYAMRLLLANPGAEATQVQVAYRRADGRTGNRSYTLAASSRQTVDVAAVHPSLSDTTLGITVEASAPIVVERTKWWGANGTLDEAVSGSAVSAGAARWLLAEGEMGGAREATTSLVVFNRGAATDVTVTLLFEDGPEAAATFPVAGGARFAVPMDQAFPAAAGRRFSVLVEGADASASLAVNREIYWHAQGGRIAGADSAATRLP